MNPPRRILDSTVPALLVAAVALTLAQAASAIDPRGWGFGVSPGEELSSLTTYQVAYELPFGFVPIHPPVPSEPFTFYAASITPDSRVSAVTAMASFYTWRECTASHRDLAAVLQSGWGTPETSERQGPWVKIFASHGVQARLACQPLKSGRVQARLILLYSAEELLRDNLQMDPETTRRAQERLRKGKSLFRQD